MGRLRWPAGKSDHGGTGVSRRLNQQNAQPAGSRRNQYGVLGAKGELVENAGGGPAGADRSDRGVKAQASGQLMQGIHCCQRLVSIAAAGHAQVDGHPLAQPLCVHPGPTRSTTPATSRPGIIGSSGRGIAPKLVPLRMLVSSKCTPLALTATRTWPAWGSRSGSCS